MVKSKLIVAGALLIVGFGFALLTSTAMGADSSGDSVVICSSVE